MRNFRRFARFPALVLIVTLGAAVVPTAALAQPPATASPEAEEAKRKGDDAMVALRYEEALASYKKAYDATHNPALLYNMGRAYEGLADFPHALESLEEFSDKAPADLKARVPKLEELLRDVRNRVATLVLSAPVADAEIRLGERTIGKTKAGQVILRVKAGPQKLVVTADGYFPFERDLTLTGGKVETVDANLAARSTSAVLRVTSPVSGAAVSLDGHGVGIVPAESVVAPGTHKVSLQRDGYDPADTNVVVAAGEKKNIDVPMAAQGSVLGKWWFWTGIGVAIAGGVVAGIALTTERGADKGTIDPGQVKAGLHF